MCSFVGAAHKIKQTNKQTNKQTSYIIYVLGDVGSSAIARQYLDMGRRMSNVYRTDPAFW